MAPHFRIGVDLGGTKIEAVVVELGGDGKPNAAGTDATKAAGPPSLGRARVATNRTLGYEHVVETTRALVFEVAKQAGIDPLATPIGVGMPGSVTRLRADGTRSELDLVKNSNTTCLNGRPFHADLVKAVGRPIVFANDANCFALAEATWGAARGARVAFGVIMGTGVGGGIVTTNAAGIPRAWNGAQGIAGEWGHVVHDPDNGPACYCGKRGCIETYLSGPAIEAEYARRTGTNRNLAEIAARARPKPMGTSESEEDANARVLISERVEVFGRALSIVINVLDPDVIVLGGGVSNLAVLYDEGACAVTRWIFNDEVKTKIVKHALGDSAGVLGAALLP
ncbi:MAG TPA: ROK family protein [Labilithrix sp.]|nr:ROK family protein [Labilithrix sp.]